MGLSIDNGTSQYILPSWLTIKGHPFSMRADVENVAFGHGGIVVGDRKANTKEITISGTSELYQTRAAHDAAMRALTAALMSGEKLIIDNSTYIKYTLSEFDHEFEELMGRRMSTVEIVLVAADPFIYSTDETVIFFPLTVSPATFTVHNPSLEVYPVITIEAAGTNASMTLVNESDNGRTFGYQDTMFTSGMTVIIDSVKGTVSRAGENTLNNMGGTFIKLLPGDNVFTYTGAESYIQVAFRERWLL